MVSKWRFNVADSKVAINHTSTYARHIVKVLLQAFSYKLLIYIKSKRATLCISFFSKDLTYTTAK
jgi:hypothetical protein